MRPWKFWRLLGWGICMFVLFIIPMKGGSVPSISIPHLDKLVHFGLFLFLSAFATSWLRSRQKNSLHIALFILLVLGVYGAVIEWLQGRFFERSADFWDWVADMIGVIMGVILYGVLHKLSLYVRKKLGIN